MSSTSPPRAACASPLAASEGAAGTGAARRGCDTLPSGSSLKICAVAEGAADVYPRLGPTRLWDTAGGTAIAIEAGCDVVALDGMPLRYDLASGLVRSGFLVTAPGGAREACIQALAPSGSTRRRPL